MQNNPQPKRILRWREVQSRTGLSRVTVWRRELQGRFPQRLKLHTESPRSPVGWYEHEIEAWLATRERGQGYEPTLSRRKAAAQAKRAEALA